MAALAPQIWMAAPVLNEEKSFERYLAQPGSKQFKARRIQMEIEKHQPRKPGTIIAGESLTTQIITGNGLPEDLSDLVFKQCQFEQVSFTGCALQDSEFEQCVFKHCNFASAQFRQVKFRKCEFYDKSMEQGCNFTFAVLQDCEFDHCDLTLCDFSRSEIYLSKLHECQLTGANFQGAGATKIIGNNVELSEATITDCNLAYANLAGSNMMEVDFSGCRMSHATLDGANLTSAILVDCELHNIEADRVTLNHADLRGAMLSGLDVRSIDMTGVKINLEQAAALLEEIGVEVT